MKKNRPAALERRRAFPSESYRHLSNDLIFVLQSLAFGKFLFHSVQIEIDVSVFQCLTVTQEISIETQNFQLSCWHNSEKTRNLEQKNKNTNKQYVSLSWSNGLSLLISFLFSLSCRLFSFEDSFVACLVVPSCVYPFAISCLAISSLNVYDVADLSWWSFVIIARYHEPFHLWLWLELFASVWNAEVLCFDRDLRNVIAWFLPLRSRSFSRYSSVSVLCFRTYSKASSSSLPFRSGPLPCWNRTDRTSIEASQRRWAFPPLPWSLQDTIEYKRTKKRRKYLLMWQSIPWSIFVASSLVLEELPWYVYVSPKDRLHSLKEKATE